MRLVRSGGAGDVLMVTNMWPHDDHPAYGIFVKRQVETLERLGCHCDVLFIEGYRSRWEYPLAALRMFGLNFRRRRPRVIHGHGGETALVVRWYLRGAVVVSYCGDDLLGTPRADCSLTWASRIRRFVLRRQATLMSATITKSEEMEQTLSAPARIRNLVVPNGVNRELFQPQNRLTARQQLGWRDDEKVVLFAADPAVERKRYWLAEAACSWAQDRVGPMRLHIAWGVSPSEMPRLMSAADCLLLTSAIEGSPNVVKEGVTTGLPVIATDVGDVRSVLAGIEPSWVCRADPSSLGTAVVECLRDPKRSNGRDRAAWLGEDLIGQRILDLYSSLS